MEIKKGQLIRWFDAKGFGFIKPEQGNRDIFIHISALQSMSHKPVVGDIIHYQISYDTNGKPRAANAMIEGDHPALTLSPLEQKRKPNRPSPQKERSHRNLTTRTSKPQNRLNYLSILFLIGAAVFVYSKVAKEKTFIDQVKTSKVEPQPRVQTKQFQCNGKIWCSEMTSCKEAKFYLRNCPGTKMDGDSDGVPCESQWCSGKR